MKNNPGKDKIVDAAFRVVGRETIAGTNMRMIAEEASMTPSNLHYYFNNMDEILGILQKKVMEEGIIFRAKCDDNHKPKTVSDALDIFFLQKMDFILREKEYDFLHMDFWQQAHINEQIKEDIAASYREWRKEIYEMIIDPFAPNMTEFNKNLLTHTLISMMQGASIQYHLESFDLSGYFSYCKYVVRTMIETDQNGNVVK